MHLARFLNDLFERGHVRLDDEPLEMDDEGRREASRILAERELVVAADFPAPTPAVDRAAAGWAAAQFYTACHFVMYRAAPIEVVRAALAAPCPAGEPAAQHYAVDLVWRFLPDLDRLTATLAPHDPLREIIRTWGGDWPLSSVGVKGCEPRRVAELLAHPGLRRAYIDRIIERRDASRLRDEQVRDLVHAALGRERAKSAGWCGELAIAATSPEHNKQSQI